MIRTNQTIKTIASIIVGLAILSSVMHFISKQIEKKNYEMFNNIPRNTLEKIVGPNLLNKTKEERLRSLIGEREQQFEFNDISLWYQPSVWEITPDKDDCIYQILCIGKIVDESLHIMWLKMSQDVMQESFFNDFLSDYKKSSPEFQSAVFQPVQEGVYRDKKCYRSVFSTEYNGQSYTGEVKFFRECGNGIFIIKITEDDSLSKYTLSCLEQTIKISPIS